MKKFLILLSFMLVAIKVCAVRIGQLYFELHEENKTAEVTGIYANMYTHEVIYSNVVIPFQIDDKGNIYKVTKIGPKAFLGVKGIYVLSIPNTIVEIGSSAFTMCPIKNLVINDLSAYCNILFADIGSSPSPELLYLNDEIITDLVIPDIQSVNNYAFYGFNCLKSILISNSVNTIGDETFTGCTELESIKVNPGNTKYDSRNNSNTIIETSSNKLLLGCKNSIIPNSVKIIGDYAFCDCTELTSINIPNGVTTIGDCAFKGCKGLSSVTIPDGVASIGAGAFYDCMGLSSVTIPDGVTSIGGGAFAWCSSMTSIIIPSSIMRIGEGAFAGCYELEKVNIYDINSWCSIQFGNESANPLSNAHNLYLAGELITNLIIPESVKSIGKYAFYGCSSLISVTIPQSVTRIGESSFYDCI